MTRKIPKVNNLVIKIGSNIIAGSGKGINEERIQTIVDVIAELKKEIPKITVVSSGAIAAGFKLLGFKNRPKEIIDKQACAAVGQARLMWYYEQAFAKHNIHAAQILITKYDFSNRRSYLNASSALSRLLELNAVPVINENDTVVVNELKYVESFGDNDNLGALVAGLIRADMLMILSDVDGLYTADPAVDPSAEIIHDIYKLDQRVINLAGRERSGVGTGGMRSKIMAAAKALKAGCCVAIINGQNPENISKFLRGEMVGTFFSSAGLSADRKKLWLSYSAIPQGAVVIDNGAKAALLEKHSSLLPSGIVSVSGRFHAGDVVKILDSQRNELAVGKVRYSAADLERIKQKKSSEIAKILGRKDSSFVIHCDEIGFY